MRTIRGIDIPNSFEDCATLMGRPSPTPRHIPGIYRPITDDLKLLHPTPSIYTLTQEGIPFISFVQNGDAILNSCSIFPGLQLQGPNIPPLVETLLNRISNCLLGTPFQIGYSSGTVVLRSTTNAPVPFQDFTILNTSTTPIRLPIQNLGPALIPRLLETTTP